MIIKSNVISAAVTGDMYVDGAGPYRGTAAGRFQGLDLIEPLYLGGVPDFRSIHRLTGHSQGFVGMFQIANSCSKKKKGSPVS